VSLHYTGDGCIERQRRIDPTFDEAVYPYRGFAMTTVRRVLLWDLDGTLVQAVRPGGFVTHLSPVLEEVFGGSGALASIATAGQTDLHILTEALRDTGIDRSVIQDRLSDVASRYRAALDILDPVTPHYHALPGARDVLHALSHDPSYFSALLTGNLQPIAAFKLQQAGLSPYITVIGGFGEDSHDRRDLPALAAVRIQRHLGQHLDPTQFIVIGDTPNDIACAHHFGSRSVAVASGMHHTGDDLRAATPDAILPDLTDTDLVLRTLAAL
jgi:phosphoglycolate phosphatase-like HAD superfamily hydrolase